MPISKSWKRDVTCENNCSRTSRPASVNMHHYTSIIGLGSSVVFMHGVLVPLRSCLRCGTITGVCPGYKAACSVNTEAAVHRTCIRD